MIALSDGVQLQRSSISGRGVFARHAFEPDDVIEVCPVIVVPAAQRPALDQTLLYDHYFNWHNKDAALAQGLGCFYNHSYNPNSVYKADFDKLTITVRALSKITAGEEITFNYNGRPESQDSVWFDVLGSDSAAMVHPTTSSKPGK